MILEIMLLLNLVHECYCMRQLALGSGEFGAEFMECNSFASNLE